MNILFVLMMVLLAIAIGALLFGFVIWGFSTETDYTCDHLNNGSYSFYYCELKLK